MALTFHKMHGAGNDFVLLDLRRQTYALKAELVRRMADRRRGIGFDQLLVLQPAQSGTAVARYEIWNTDGTTARQCGNGARCIGLFLLMNGEAANSPIALDSPSGRVTIRSAGEGEFEAGMGTPSFEPAAVPIDLDPVDGCYQLEYDERQLRFGAVSMGNPHCTLIVEDIETAPVEEVGSWLARHQVFPHGCNVGFAQIINRAEIRLRVFERGVGETQACGSGACAAAVLLCRAGLVDGQVSVILPGGHLVIKWPGQGVTGSSAANVSMRGPASYVFRGEWND